MSVAFSLGTTPLSLAINSVVVAGWTGRNIQAVQHHIDELAALGISPPSQVPLYYRVSNALLTQSDTIDVLGDDSCMVGEATGAVCGFPIRAHKAIMGRRCGQVGSARAHRHTNRMGSGAHFR